MLGMLGVVRPRILAEAMNKCQLPRLHTVRKLFPGRVVFLPELCHGKVPQRPRSIGLQSSGYRSRAKTAVLISEYADTGECAHQAKKRWSVRPARNSQLVDCFGPVSKHIGDTELRSRIERTRDPEPDNHLLHLPLRG